MKKLASLFLALLDVRHDTVVLDLGDLGALVRLLVKGVANCPVILCHLEEPLQERIVYSFVYVNTRSGGAYLEMPRGCQTSLGLSHGLGRGITYLTLVVHNA